MILRYRKLLISAVAFSIWIFFSNISFPQDAITKAVTALSPIIKYSYAILKNNLNYDVSVYGRKNNTDTFINKFGPFEEFSVETKDYDSLKFYSRWDFDESFDKEATNFLEVKDNQKFEFYPEPIFELTGLDMIVDNRALKRLIGKKLYNIKITDDVNPSAIEAAAYDDSAPYIDIIKIDTVSYQIKLKAKDEFLRNLTEAEKVKWSKGEELIFPIGVKLYDTAVKSDVQDYQIYLKKKKKSKKTSG
ncbi:MAG: hypothetical protein HGGPFJEG_02066 [Ignavibacteria bacterium]|nr:hypothetical protein [Ignavibacteria bacterium]